MNCFKFNVFNKGGTSGSLVGIRELSESVLSESVSATSAASPTVCAADPWAAAADSPEAGTASSCLTSVSANTAASPTVCAAAP